MLIILKDFVSYLKGGKEDMTEKRFECDKGSRIIIDNETKLHYIMTLDWECRLVTKLLNQFADENEQLKKELESFKPIIFESDGKPVTLYKKGDVE